MWQKFCNMFCSSYIRTWETDKILVLFLKDLPWKLYKNCVNKFLLTGSDSFPKLKYVQMSQTFDNTTRIPTFNHLKKIITTRRYRLFSYCLCRIIGGASFKKNQDFIVFFSRDICKTRMSSKHFYHAGTKHYHRGCSFWAWENYQNQLIRIYLHFICILINN